MAVVKAHEAVEAMFPSAIINVALDCLQPYQVNVANDV